MDKPFTPNTAATVNIDVSGSSQRVAISSSGFIDQVRIMNNGSATVWCNFGDVTVTAAATTGFPVAAGVTEVMSVNPTPGTAIYVAAIAASTTGKIYFTPGGGI